MVPVAEDHVNEVARRLIHKGVAPGGHHCSIVRHGPNIAFQIVFTRRGGIRRLETVWTFDGPARTAALNKRRGVVCKKALDTAGPPREIKYRDTDVYAYVGFSFDVPSRPDAAFYDRVAEHAAWVRDHFGPGDLDSVK